MESLDANENNLGFVGKTWDQGIPEVRLADALTDAAFSVARGNQKETHSYSFFRESCVQRMPSNQSV